MEVIKFLWALSRFGSIEISSFCCFVAHCCSNASSCDFLVLETFSHPTMRDWHNSEGRVWTVPMDLTFDSLKRQIKYRALFLDHYWVVFALLSLHDTKKHTTSNQRSCRCCMIAFRYAIVSHHSHLFCHLLKSQSILIALDRYGAVAFWASLNSISTFVAISSTSLWQNVAV
jgi:hypothetical protein